MTANDTSPGDGQERTDSKYYSSLRAATADLAGLRWDRADLDADAMDEWPALAGSCWKVGRLDVDDLTASVIGEHGQMHADAGETESPQMEVTYSDRCISLDFAGDLDAGEAGALAKVSPAQARQAAALLAQAAEELERRREIQAARDDSHREAADGD